MATEKWARDAADAVIGELNGRGGFDGWFDSIDEDTQLEIMEAIAETIQQTVIDAGAAP